MTLTMESMKPCVTRPPVPFSTDVVVVFVSPEDATRSVFVMQILASIALKQRCRVDDDIVFMHCVCAHLSFLSQWWEDYVADDVEESLGDQASGTLCGCSCNSCCRVGDERSRADAHFHVRRVEAELLC